MRKNYFILSILLSICSILSLNAQNGLISGIVYDDSGVTLPGAYVMIKGTSRGVSTDLDGKYTITNVSMNSTLIFQYVGMVTKEIKYTGQKRINVSLKSNAVGLNEAVVVGYGSQQKKTVVGSITQTKGEELLKAGSVTTVSEALTGILPGVSTMQAAGQPGATAASILIRGKASWTDSSPLYLVDGVERDFNDLDPNEIASISVLKDASATAVFGVKAANGVILVTTKRGEKGKTKIHFSANLGVKVPTIDTDYAADYATNLRYRNLAALNDGVYDNFTPQSTINTWADPNRDMDRYSYTSFINKLLGKQGYTQQYNLNISGGTNFVDYFTSFGYNYDGDIFNLHKQKDFDPRTYQKRYNYRSNIDFHITKNTKFSVSLSGDIKNWNGNFVTNQSGTGYDGLYLHRLYEWPMIGAPAVLSNGLLGTEEGVTENPNFIGRMEREGQYMKRSNKLFTDFSLEQYLFKKTVKLQAKLSYNYYRGYNSSITQDELYYYPDYVNGGFIQAIDQDAIKPAPHVNNETLSSYNNSLYYELSALYKKQFQKNNISALGLFSRRRYQNKVQFPHYEESWVGRVTYNYDSKYLVEFNGAYNGNENFAPGLRFGFFPSAAVGWVATQEKFVKKALPFLNFLKFRYSYGEVGSDKGLGSQRFTYLSTFSAHNTHMSYGYPKTEYGTVYVEGAPSNPDNTWETAVKQDLGIELSTLKSRLHFTIDFFNEKRRGILMARKTIPYWFGNSSPKANIGKTKNHGIDIELKWDDRIGKDFNYWLKANMSMSENRVVEADDPPATAINKRVAGKPIGYNSGLLSPDYYQNWDDVYNAPISSYNPNGLMPGDIRFVDYNADGIVDDDDKVPIGDVGYASSTYAFSFGFSWRNWSMSAMLNGVYDISKNLSGTYLWEYDTSSSLGFMLLNNEQKDYWTPNNKNAAHPVLHLTTNGNNDEYSTYTLRNSSFLRLRNVEIKYRLGKKTLNKLKVFSNLEIYFNGNNLYTWTNLPSSFDPEAKNLEVYPIAKRFNFGVRFSL